VRELSERSAARGGIAAVRWRRSFVVRPMMALQRGVCTMKSNMHRGRWAGLAALLLVGVVMNGCSGGGGAGSSGGGNAGGGSASPSPSLELASQKPSVVGAETTYSGVLGADSIEGGCSYLQTADGKRYELLPPDGWHLDKGSAQLTGPDGALVARAGDAITVKGHEADMVSICQIGPIIQAVEITAGG
jgi:hypothetical protein